LSAASRRAPFLAWRQPACWDLCANANLSNRLDKWRSSERAALVIRNANMLPLFGLLEGNIWQQRGSTCYEWLSAVPKGAVERRR
jgi:hypothetical protein